MIQIECPKPAYERLVKSGLAKKILESKDKFHDIVIGSISGPPADEDAFRKAKEYFQQKTRESEKTGLYRDILQLEALTEDEESQYKEADEILMQHPSLLAFVILGEDVLNPLNYGFKTRRQLEEAITSFCLGEKWSLFGLEGDYFWRNGRYKNQLSNSYHGDCWFHQTDVSGKDRVEKTLFADVQVFDTWKDVSGKVNGITADWSDWRNFLMTNLRYAEAIGNARMPEIINWREILKQVGSVGTATTEAMFGEETPEWALDELTKAPILRGDTEKLENIPISIVSGSLDSRNIFFPYVSDRRLIYLKEDENGSIVVPTNFMELQNKRFSPHLVYEEADLPHLLRGTYRLFARDRSLLPKIMDRFTTKVS